jgi:DNA-binding MarR family transcriptional regulator
LGAVQDTSDVQHSDSKTELVDRLRAVISRGNRHLRMTYADDSLSPSQLEVLAMLARRGPMRLSELATEEGLNPTMVSRIVAKLENADLARRTPDEVDRRVVHVAATEKGRSLHHVIRRQRTNALKLALEQMSPSDQRTLADAMPVLELLVKSLKLPRR